MPYTVEGSPPVLPALAGLAAAYFQIKNENQQIKQEVAASKTNQAATQQQYGLDRNNQPIPPPWMVPVAASVGAAVTGANKPASSASGPSPDIAKAGAAAAAVHAANAPQKAAAFDPDPSSGSTPSNPQEAMQRAQYWMGWVQRLPPGSFLAKTALDNANMNLGLVDEFTKAQYVPVKGPHGETLYESVAQYLQKTQPSYGDLHASPNTILTQKGENHRQQVALGTVPQKDIYNKQTISADTALSVTHADARSAANRSRSARGGPTFNSVNAMLNSWSQGTQGFYTDPTTKQQMLGHVPPSPQERNQITNAVDLIQHASNPRSAAASAIAAYKQHYGKNADPQAVRILESAGDAASNGGSDADQNPQYPGP